MTRSFFATVFLLIAAVTGGSALIQNVKDDYYGDLGMTSEYPAQSCREIYNKNPIGRQQSGYYWIKSCETTKKVCTNSISI